MSLLNSSLLNPWLLKNSAIVGPGNPMPHEKSANEPERANPTRSRLILKLNLPNKIIADVPRSHLSIIRRSIKHLLRKINGTANLATNKIERRGNGDQSRPETNQVFISIDTNIIRKAIGSIASMK
jgi:hypothetical protein